MSEQAACMGDHYLDPIDKVEFVIHRKKGPERYVATRLQLMQYINGEAWCVDFAKVKKHEC